MTRSDRSGAVRLARAVSFWAAPLLLVAQFVGNFPGHTLPFTLVYLLLFSGALWIGEPRRPDESTPLPSNLARMVGFGLVAVGGLGLAVGGLRIFGVEPVSTWFEGGGWWANRPGRILLPTLAAWPLALGIPLSRRRRTRPGDFARLGALIGLAFLALLAAGLDYQGLPILSSRTHPVPVGISAAAAGALAAVALFPDRRPALALGVLVGTGLALRTCGLWTWTIDPSIRDMLPLVSDAIDSALSGENPYRVYQMQRGSEVPLTYLPGLWLLYSLPRLAEVDIRWMGLFADAAIAASLWWVSRGGGRSDRAWGSAAAVGLASIWLFLPTVHWNGIYAEPHVWWGILALWLASTLRRRWWIAAALTGLGVATRHFALVVAPFVAIALVRDLGWRRALPRFALAGGIAGALLVPFVAADPHSFWFGTLEWLRAYGPEHSNWFRGKPGFAEWMYREGLHDWMLPVQAGLTAICALGYAVRPSDDDGPGRQFLGFAGTAYILFVMFNGIIWYSFYLGAFLFVALALAHVPRGESSAPPDAPLSDALRASSAALLAVSLAAGGWIAYTLVRFHSESGLREVRERLAERLEPDDLLVDRTRKRVEFVDKRGLDELSTGADVAYDLFEHKPLVGSEPVDVWIAARTEWNLDYIERIERLGRVRSRMRSGYYTLLEVRVPGLHRRLSRTLGALEPTVRRLGARESKSYRRQQTGDSPLWRAPDFPKWVEVKRQNCQIGPLRENLLYVHPHRRAEIRLTWREVQLGRSILLYGGIRNPAVRWDRGDVRVDISIAGERREKLVLRNRPGPWWTSIDTAERAGESHPVTLTVSAEDDRQRWTCLEGAILGVSTGE